MAKLFVHKKTSKANSKLNFTVLCTYSTYSSSKGNIFAYRFKNKCFGPLTVARKNLQTAHFI